VVEYEAGKPPIMLIGLYGDGIPLEGGPNSPP